MKRLFALFSFCLMNTCCLAQTKSLPDFAEMVEKLGPSVVNISSKQAPKGQSQAAPFTLDENDPALELFKRFKPRHPGSNTRQTESKSLGSGFIVSTDGYILTNSLVVDAADEMTVRLNDKREFKAKLVGSDQRSDIALLKIEATGLPAVKFGDPGQLRLGEWVVAIGAPVGFDNSITAGLISAKGRAASPENYPHLLQTDLAINPGNAGGPLFNMRGEVVGINSLGFSRDGGYKGSSFAVPIDIAQDIQNQLRTTGKVTRGKLGVVIQEISKEQADSLGLTKAAGAVVNSVEKGGPADKAGIEPGDIILRYDGKPIVASADLQRLVAMTKPGLKTNVQVWRRGESRSVTVIIGEILDDKQGAAKLQRNAPPEQNTNRFGLLVSELTAEQKKELKLNNGLLIEDIKGNARSDLKPGDIIIALISKGATTEIRTVDQFNKLLTQFEKGSSVTVLIRRGETQTFITIKG